MNFFAYGPLCHRELIEAVLGRAVQPGEHAILSDFRVEAQAGTDFPSLVPVPGGEAEGQVVKLDRDDADRLEYFHAAVTGFRREAVSVVTANGTVVGETFRAHDDQPSAGPWSLEDWSARFAPATVMATVELMQHLALGDRVPVFEQLRTRAASRLRAMQSPTPTDLRCDGDQESIEVLSRTIPYRHYFALDESEIRHPTYDGGQSRPLLRAAFLAGDAVTVLPYDPRRDAVLVIEQFRFGTFARGDRHPWVLEPPAGRIDVGETPEQAAERELREEAGIAAGELHSIGSYYPSPGVSTEYLYSFIAICDLTDSGGRIAGLDVEDEDIRTHVLSFEQAMGLAVSGEIETAPLLYSLFWLVRNRERFRTG